MTNKQINAHVRAAEYKWLDQIDIRNTSKYGSARHARAVEKAAEIEDEASMMVFNDTAHTMLQCVQKLKGELTEEDEDDIRISQSDRYDELEEGETYN